ncbi:MAG: hypothetical protein QXY45_03100 [Candidatus Aenigmatarchaeota archaeon]
MRKMISFLILLILPSVVLGGTISLTTSITTDKFTSEGGIIEVSLANYGDEPAYNTQLSIISDYFSADPVNVGILGINNPITKNITLKSKNVLKDGNYPVVLLVEYTDANGYPFSSVSPINIIYKNSYPSRITGAFESIEVDGNRPKNLVMKLKNMDQVDHNIKVKLVLPNELSSDETEKSISIKSKEEKSIIFKVSNFAGIPGSSYVVLGIIEYEDEYQHSSISSGIVKIVEGKSLFKPSKIVIFSIVGVLLLMLILYQLKGKIEVKVSGKKKKS